jgi:hypothetical protein
MGICFDLHNLWALYQGTTFSRAVKTGFKIVEVSKPLRDDFLAISSFSAGLGRLAEAR